MATILNSAILDIAMLHKTLIQSYSIWLKVIHSDSTWWWQPSWTLPSCIQPFAQKNFTHAFSLKLMIAAILNSAILDSDTAILDSNTLLSSLRFTQKHSYCTLTLTQASSIWLKLIHSDSTWWWQPSWILPSWIKSFCTKKLHSFILTQLYDGIHLEFYHVGFRHCHLGFRWLVIFSQIHSETISLHSDSDSN